MFSIMNVAVTNPGRKDDTGKIRVDLLPAGALIEVGKVLTFGAKKYGAENTWQNVTPFWPRYFAALMRHAFEVMKHGKDSKDPESGLFHMAHLACCALFLLSSLAGFDQVEDRLPAPPRVPSEPRVQSFARTVIHTQNPDPEATSVTIPSGPEVGVTVDLLSEDPDADPPPSIEAESDPFPPVTLPSSKETEYVRAEHVVIPKDYHVIHQRYGRPVEDKKAEDAAEAWATMTAYECFAKSGDVIMVVKQGELVYHKDIS